MMRSLAMAAVSLLLTFVVLEVVFRLVFPIPPTWHDPQIRHLKSPLLGWVLPENTDSFTIDAPVHVNSLGLRDDEIPLAKPAGETRILSLGDSFTFALGVRFEDLYVQQLESSLRSAHPGRAFQVINAGVAGYNSRQERIYLLAQGLDFEPDLITIGFYFNDLVGNQKPLPDLTSTPRIESSQFNDEGEHALPPWIRDRLRRSVLLYQLVIRSKMLVQALDPPVENATYQAQRAILAGDREALAPFVEATLPHLLAVAEEGRRRGIPVVLLFFPMENQLRANTGAGVLTEMIRAGWEPTGMPFIDLEPAWRESLDRGANPFLPYDLHPDREGMEIVANELLAEITERGWLGLSGKPQAR